MIDTLHFKIHDLSKHSYLSSYLLEKSNKKKTHKVLETDEKTGLSVSKNRMRFKYQTYHDTLKTSVVSAHFTEVKSNHYNIAVKLDTDNDCIHVNVSLPKYFHQTNVFQLIPHIFDNDYIPFTSATSPNDVSKSSFKLFRKLFKSFCERAFPSIDMGYVEFQRIDFCYNQVLDCKEDALRYLNYIKTKRKKHQRDQVNEPTDYGHVGFSYVTKDYSFKVYHKGTEFYKNDAKELKKLNDKAKRNYFNIPVIGELADRTLRYELTSRLKNLNYVYNHRFLFKTKLERQYDDWKNYKNKPQLLRELAVEDRFKVKQNIKIIDAHKNTVKKLMFKDLTQNMQYEVLGRREYDKNFFLLNQNAWDCYIAYFWEMVQDFQIKNQYSTMLDLSKLINSAEFENEIRLRGINRSKNHDASITKQKLILMMHLLETNTFDEIRKKNLFPSSTFYRYRKFLEKFGIEKNAHFGISISASTDFKRYYEFLMFNFSKINHLKVYPL